MNTETLIYSLNDLYNDKDIYIKNMKNSKASNANKKIVDIILQKCKKEIL